MAFESTDSKDADLSLEAANHHSSALLLYQAALNKPNSRAQILLLVCLSFIHRQMPVFSKTYLTQLSKYDYTDGWSILGLTGCPPSVVQVMYDLSLLAFEYERSTRPSHKPFDLSTIHKLVQRITSMENDYRHIYSHNDMGNADDVSVSTSTYHLFEAWRKCVLLYANRVFLEHERSPKIMYFSRLILDHISCIREESDLQKQVLLPLFLAGAETQSEDDRHFCRVFCAKMLSKTTYSLFTDTRLILEQIWAHTEDNTWWGSFISGRSHEIRGTLSPGELFTKGILVISGEAAVDHRTNSLELVPQVVGGPMEKVVMPKPILVWNLYFVASDQRTSSVPITPFMVRLRVMRSIDWGTSGRLSHFSFFRLVGWHSEDCDVCPKTRIDMVYFQTAEGGAAISLESMELYHWACELEL
ncbi:hypothetical protein TSTA_022110 [Talaromyces stipitatus ATCC 10500]|uniref:Uncharacterized protein n=1 Tax=Talaromyces stipitatus (strain ATCC 10500 / CBS 375.48 / QM 6759 / NRRL 1006) TaxID=441959 RepID=B8MHZ3_TALSN|nr:uncharacterized protein TSTA_022110 [Talaromyces stipitatus ATCC 10500]EED17155.1 hypothetical protein TSTA_022110 [Talaromyces stipitatus ATCC 10500]